MISENTKITLTLGQLRRIVAEGVAAGVAKDAALDAADAAIFGGAPVLKATEKGAEAYLKNDASVAEEPANEQLPEIPEMSEKEFKGYALFLKRHGDGGRMLEEKDPRYRTILRKMLALGDNVEVSSNGGNFQASGNNIAHCLMVSHQSGFKAMQAAIQSGGSDEDAIMAYLTASGSAKGSYAGKTFAAAIEKLKTGNFTKTVAQNVKQAATTTATSKATQQAAQATQKVAQKAVSTVGKVMGTQGSSGIQRIAPQSGVFGGDNLDTVDLDF